MAAARVRCPFLNDRIEKQRVRTDRPTADQQSGRTPVQRASPPTPTTPLDTNQKGSIILSTTPTTAARGSLQGCAGGYRRLSRVTFSRPASVSETNDALSHYSLTRTRGLLSPPTPLQLALPSFILLSGWWHMATHM